MISTILAFIAVLALLVFVHELGHFMAAKHMGVQVDEFAIGFPPRIFSYRKGDTLYSVNWIPLGGFVKIKGETGEDRENPSSFSNKSILARAYILSAGVIMNMILAGVLLSVTFMMGVTMPLDRVSDDSAAMISDSRVEIVSVLEKSPAYEAGILSHDRILSVNYRPVKNTDEFNAILREGEDREISLALQRKQEILNFWVKTEWNDDYQKNILGIELAHIGIVSYAPLNAAVKGFSETAVITWEVGKALAGLVVKFIQREKVDFEVTGPIGIAVLTGEVVERGFVQLLQFSAFLSLNLAIVNILPFPALDGGRILFLFFELLRGGRSLSMRFENIAHGIGFALLITLMVVVTFQDIQRYGGRIFGFFVNLAGG
ncbi:MAG: RIP metalloprotease RseP [Parcubacteria group bacterium]|nr:RIP metalloprotease RseP [Parcubacteria group bacterium]